MKWKVEFHPAFEEEIHGLSEAVVVEILAGTKILAAFGPNLGRPNMDTLKNSKYPNMKEFRCDADGGAWRVAFAFDPDRKAIFLVAGDKSGISEKRFYKRLIATADMRYDQHLATRIRRS